jgi:hypothetical protein
MGVDHTHPDVSTEATRTDMGVRQVWPTEEDFRPVADSRSGDRRNRSNRWCRSLPTARANTARWAGRVKREKTLRTRKQARIAKLTRKVERLGEMVAQNANRPEVAVGGSLTTTPRSLA